MIIAAIQKTSLIDFPGEIATVIFTQGCNFRCPYCHNPELVDSRQYREALDNREVFAYLEFRKKLIDGVVITGGEPTLQKDLPEFLKKVKALGYAVKLDTNGTNPTMIKKLLKLGLVDYIAMDYKAPLSKYAEVVRSHVNLQAIIESVEIIKKSGIKYEFRTTVVKQLLTPQDIKIIKSEIGRGEKYCIQKFNPTKTLDKNFMNCKTIAPQILQEINDSTEGFFKEEIVR